MSNPSTASLEDLIFCWLLVGPFPEFSIADGLRPSGWKYSSEAGVAAVVLHVSAPHTRTALTVV